MSVVKILLAYKADLNAQPCKEGGRTTLRVAITGGYTDIVELLLENGADPSGLPQATRPHYTSGNQRACQNCKTALGERG